jgi:hypothetical protein
MPTLRVSIILFHVYVCVHICSFLQPGAQEVFHASEGGYGGGTSRVGEGRAGGLPTELSEINSLQMTKTRQTREEYLGKRRKP